MCWDNYKIKYSKSWLSFDNLTTSNAPYKVRSYNLNLPIAIKFGNMNGTYFFGGYAVQLPTNYEQKTFVNGDKKDKFNEWFSARQASIYRTWFADVNLPDGFQLKFNYYRTSRCNNSYTTNEGGINIKPYADIETNVFDVSLSFQFLK